MDLAKHFFLSTTLEEIHRDDQRIVSEALKQQELLWDQHGFACRYGEDVSTVCHELQDAYYCNEGSLRLLIKEAQIIEDIPTFQLKQWFLNHLAGEKVDAATEDLPQEFIDRVNRLFYKVLREHHQQVEQYRQRVRQYIKEMHFSRHRIQLENLASNTLELLAWIDEKDLTMRDLKPENLFVAGETNAYPLFLNDSKKFSIGLIDVETAVVMDSKHTEEIPQPQLAGTPLYATPSHLLSNVILAEVYGDVRTILHLQDWYATIAIIYKIITGKNMFSATARVFPDLVKQIKLMDPAGPDMDKDIARLNRLFWSSAVAEFKQSIAADLNIFERIEVAVPASMLVDIVRSLHAGCDDLSAALAKTVSQQSVFVGRHKCQFLMDVSVEKITAMKQKLLQETPHGDKRKAQHEKAIAILVRIEEQKKSLQRKLEAAASLKVKVGAIAADQLLEAMFERVFTSMYLAHWPAVDPVKWSGGADGRLDMATYQATI
jgi:serine/threonine protein kinase